MHYVYIDKLSFVTSGDKVQTENACSEIMVNYYLTQKV